MTSIIENRPTSQPRRIDYARMQQVFPRQKAALTRAIKTGSAEKVARVCIDAVRVWDEIGAWPDDWAHFKRGMNSMPGCQFLSFGDVAYGYVTVLDDEER